MKFQRMNSPLCVCGCGKRVCWNRGGKKGWNKFISGHNAKGNQSAKGYHHTKVFKKYMSERMSGKNNFMYGKTHTEEARKKISEKMEGKISPRKGCKLSNLTKRKIGDAQKGKKISEEIKNKIRISFAKTLAEHPEIRDKLRTWKGRKHTKGFRKMIKRFMKNAWATPEFRSRLIGENASGWRGGKSFEPYTPEFNESLRLFIFERDGNVCQNPQCKKSSKRLCPHHIDYNKKNCDSLNLITLCYSCNVRANFNREIWKNFYQEIMLERYRYAA